MRWMSFGSLNSSISRSLKSGRPPGGTTIKLPAVVPVVRQPGEANPSVHMSSIADAAQIARDLGAAFLRSTLGVGVVNGVDDEKAFVRSAAGNGGRPYREPTRSPAPW